MDRYRLAPLRVVRRIDERAKRNDLAIAVDSARATADEVAAAAARVDNARAIVAAARAARATHADARMLAISDRYAARRLRELDDAVAAHARARAAHAGHLQAIEGARTRLTAARADKQLIERHFERWRAARSKLMDSRED